MEVTSWWIVWTTWSWSLSLKESVVLHSPDSGPIAIASQSAIDCVHSGRSCPKCHSIKALSAAARHMWGKCRYLREGIRDGLNQTAFQYLNLNSKLRDWMLFFCSIFFFLGEISVARWNRCTFVPHSWCCAIEYKKGNYMFGVCKTDVDFEYFGIM